MTDPRPPTSLEVARSEVEAQSKAPIDLHAVSATLDRANRIDLEFVTPLATDYDEVYVQTHVLARTLLGDVRFGRWIGKLAAVEPARGLFARWSSNRGVPIAELPALVDGLVERVRAALPAQPWSARPAMPRVRVRRNASPDGPRRSDVATADTVHEPLFEASRDGGGFATERYTRHDETFAYLMIEGGDARAMERRVDAALGASGATTGWAAGTRFAYVDLALAEVPSAVEKMRPILEGTTTAWLYFLDDERAAAPIVLGSEARPSP
jgi:hypothetical protein